MGLAASHPFATPQPTPSGSSAASGPALAAAAAHGAAPAITDPVALSAAGETGDVLIGIDDVQKALNRSRASVYRYTNTDPHNLNPGFNPRKLNPEYRSDQKDALLFHPNEVARFARDVLRIKEVTVEVLNAPSTATQQLLASILEELREIRLRLDGIGSAPADLAARRDQFDQSRPAA